MYMYMLCNFVFYVGRKVFDDGTESLPACAQCHVHVHVVQFCILHRPVKFLMMVLSHYLHVHNVMYMYRYCCAILYFT